MDLAHRKRKGTPLSARTGEDGDFVQLRNSNAFTTRDENFMVFTKKE